jgi:MurNAc alpha-1-phosphate uridylyltransferase
MILAAGKGERMRPLTDHTPKPLLEVGGKALIEHHIAGLGAAGFEELVINVSHLGQQIVDFCGDGRRWGLAINYSHEDQPLETAGGIQRALPQLGRQPFLVVNGDIWTDYDFAQLKNYRPASGEVAHLVMVRNPPQHAEGDFLLDAEGWVRERPPGEIGMTYSGVGVYTPGFFAGMQPGKLALRPLLDDAIRLGQLTGEYHPGGWEDVGTPQRLAALDEAVSSSR